MVIKVEVMNFPIAEAKAKFSELISRAEAGEEIEITRHGKVVATISAPPTSKDKTSLIGAFKDKVRMADDFDVLGPEWDEYIK